MTPSELQQAKALADGFRGRFVYDGERGDLVYFAARCDARTCEHELFADGTPDCAYVLSEYINDVVAEPIAGMLNAVPALVAEVERLTRERDEARAASGIKDWAGDVRLAAKFAADLAACRTGAAAMVARVQEESQAHKERLAVVTADRDSLRALLVEACELANEGWAYAGDYFRDKWQADARISAILAAAGKVGE